MDKKFVLAIDAGTTSSRAILFDKNGKINGVAQYEFNQIFPKESWVEHDAEEIWDTQLKAINDVLNNSNIDINQIDSIGITNQRETTVIWDKKTGKPVFNAIVWQDRRTADFCKELIKEGKDKVILDKTGLVIDAYFSGTKIKWILDKEEEYRSKANQGELIFGTIDTWLIWNLTKGEYHVKCDEELLSIFNVPKKILPKVIDSSSLVVKTDKSLFGESIPISGIAGDQQASLFGQLCLNPGDVKNTYGTGCFCVMNTGDKVVKSKNKMLSTIGWRINGKITYALEGSVLLQGH